MEPVLKLHALIEITKPFLQAINVVMLLVCAAFGSYSYFKRPDRITLLIVVAALIGAFTVGVYMVFSIQLGWKIVLLPVETRRWLHVVVSALYPIELIVWPIILLAVCSRNMKKPS